MDDKKLQEIQSRKLSEEQRKEIRSKGFTREIALDVRSINTTERTASFVFAAGALVPRWYGIEKLDMSPRAVRLERWTKNPPFLHNHDVDKYAGDILNGRLEDGRLLGTVKFSRNELGEEILQDIQDGLRHKASIMYITHSDRELTPDEMNEEEKRMALEYNLPVILVTDWEPLEGSSVWQNADIRAEMERTLRALTQDEEGATAIERTIQKKVEEAINKRLPADAAQNHNQHNPQGGRTVEPITKEQLDAAVKAERERAVAEIEERNRKADEANKERVREITAAAESFKEDVPDALVRAASAAADKNVTLTQFYKELREARATEIEKRKNGNAAGPAANMPTDDEEITDLREFIEPWERRTAKVLIGLSMRAQGKHELAELKLKEAAEMEKAMSQRQRKAELKRTLELVNNSGLSRSQQKRLMSGLSASAGGNLVPTPMLAEIFAIVEQTGVARRYFRPIAMTSDKLDLNSISTKPTAYWVTEGSAITATDLAFGQGQMNAEKLAAITAWTTELEEDAIVAMLPLIIQWIGEAIYVKEDVAGFIGDGGASYGSQTGALIASTNIVTLETGKTLIAHITADDLKSLRDAVKVSMRRGAMYFLPPALISHLEGMKNSQGDYIYRPPAAGMPATLWGYPIAENEGIDALTQSDAASTKVAGFGNPKNVLMGMRRSLDMYLSREGIIQDTDESILVNALQQDASILRVTERIAFETVLTTAISVLRTAAS